MMSNALSVAPVDVCRMLADAVKAPTSQPLREVLETPLIYLYAIGLCVLVVLIVRRMANSAKLTLRRAPGRPNCIHPVHLLLLLVAWVGVQQLVSLLLQAYLPAKSPELTILTGTAGAMVLLVGSVVVAAATFRFGLRRGMGLSLRHWLYDTGRGVIGYLAVAPVCMTLLWLINPLVPPDQRIHELLKMLPALRGGWRVMTVVLAVVLVPLAEEMFFRGLCQSMLRRFTNSPWLAILVTSVFFALVHGNYAHMPALFVLAVVLGYNYE
ncbi:MAG: CPBP family intramembrane metalloprotease, partial [Phycisphaerae bacterium]|nr:CPBP family intramembrane metalloprotease [Phycisphaerae bacterium]